jgi:hypothetical protein
MCSTLLKRKKTHAHRFVALACKYIFWPMYWHAWTVDIIISLVNRIWHYLQSTFFSSSRVLNTLFSSPIHVSICLVIPLCFWGNLIFFNQLFLVFRSGTSMEITSDIRNTACGIFPIGVVRLDTCIWCMSISIVPNTQDTDVLSCIHIFCKHNIFFNFHPYPYITYFLFSFGQDERIWSCKAGTENIFKRKILTAFITFIRTRGKDQFTREDICILCIRYYGYWHTSYTGV